MTSSYFAMLGPIAQDWAAGLPSRADYAVKRLASEAAETIVCAFNCRPFGVRVAQELVLFDAAVALYSARYLRSEVTPEDERVLASRLIDPDRMMRALRAIVAANDPRALVEAHAAAEPLAPPAHDHVASVADGAPCRMTAAAERIAVALEIIAERYALDLAVEREARERNAES